MGSSYRDLLVWQQSYGLTKDVYKLCTKLPDHERYGLVSQIQRACVSIPSNIAEGQQRRGSKEFKQFLYIARGSCAELSTQLQLVNDIYDIDTSGAVDRTEQIQKMLYALIQKL